MRKNAKEQIFKIQSENRKSYNLRRRPPNKYKIGDLVAIKRTQYGPGLKLKRKYLGPYEVVKIKLNDTYDVKRASDSEGPKNTNNMIMNSRRIPSRMAELWETSFTTIWQPSLHKDEVQT